MRLRIFFETFEDEPFAAGSLGQVYKARLNETGELVAVKVQRAEIQKPSLPTSRSLVGLHGNCTLESKTCVPIIYPAWCMRQRSDCMMS